MIEIKKRGTEVLTDVSCFRKHSRLTKSIEVVSDSFEGESVVARHRMIYKAIWDELQGPIHAVDSIEAKTPSEAGF